MMLMLVLQLSAFGQQILINEVLYNPDGSDDGSEWIELCNPGSEPVSLDSWSIENAGTSWSEVFNISTASLDPGEYLVVGYGSASLPGSFSPNLQNGGSASDGLRLVDSSGAVIDTVLYDSPNSNELEDDTGSTSGGTAPSAGSGHSLGRTPDCTDSDDSAEDFSEIDIPSPGEANAAKGSGGERDKKLIRI